MISHLYPIKGAWQHHSERLARLPMLLERKVLGVVTDDKTDSIEEVRDVYKDWEILEFKNDSKLREVVTYSLMLPMVVKDDPNLIILCHHHKGVQSHNAFADNINWWVDAMYKTVFENPTGVVAAMSNGASVVGSFRRQGKMLGTRYQWHFSGSYYAVRACRVFPAEAFPYTLKWWGTESWPGHTFPLGHSACLFGDNVGDMYKIPQQPREALDNWSNV